MTTTKAEELAARLESGWCPIESPGDMQQAAAELRRLAAVEAQAQEPVGEAHSMPGTGGFTMACFSAATVPVGTKLYAAPVEQAAKAVPAGFVLVPVAMTPEMRTALLDYAGPGYVDEECLPRVWSAMLAAAPTQPAPEAQRREAA